MEAYTITVLQDTLTEAKLQVIKLINKLKRFGIESKVTFGSPKLTRINKDNFLTTDINIEVDGIVVKHEGYDYIATLEKCSEDFNFVYTHLEEDFSEYFDSKFRCDHCGTNRDRKKVHLFRDSNGEDKIIASTCSKEYFGGNVNGEINSHLKAFDALEIFTNKFDFSFEDGEESSIGRSGGKDIHEFVKRCLYVCLTEREYISSSKAEEQLLVSTVQTANSYGGHGNSFPNDFHEVTGKYDLNGIIDYWEDLFNKEKTTFHHNIYASLCSSNFKDGFVAWGVWSYLKDCLGLFKVETLNEYFGEVKEKVELELKVTTCKTGSSSYGWWELINFVDKDGRVFVWFTSTVNDRIEESKKDGSFLKVKATIKKHEEYNDTKQTYLTRVK